MHATATSVPLLPPFWRRVAGVARLVLATTCAVALVFRFQWGLGSITFEPGNFFAYLTMQSNIAFAIVTAGAGILMLRGRAGPGWMNGLRAGVLSCTVTAGIVFAAIVQQSSARGVRVDVPWSDVILHFVLPVLALVDWVGTPHTRPPFRLLVFVLGYVGTWGGITMLRGESTGWYPYFFLDPNQTDGPAEFLLLSGIALAVFALVGLGLIAIPPTRGSTPRTGRGSAGREPAGQRHPARSDRERSRLPRSPRAQGGRSPGEG